MSEKKFGVVPGGPNGVAAYSPDLGGGAHFGARHVFVWSGCPRRCGVLNDHVTPSFLAGEPRALRDARARLLCLTQGARHSLEYHQNPNSLNDRPTRRQMPLLFPSFEFGRESDSQQEVQSWK